MQSLWMLAAAFFTALTAAFAKSGAADFGACELLLWRSVFAVAALAAWSLIAGKTLRTKHFASHMKRSFLGTMGTVIWFWTLGILPLGAAMPLNYMSPIYMAAIAAFAALRLGRRPDLRLIAAVAAGFSGVLIVLRPDFSSAEALPSLIGLTAGMFSTAAYLQIRALIREGEPEWRIVFYFSLFGVGFGLLGTLLFEGGLTRITTENILPLLGMGVCAVLSQLSLTLSWGAKNPLVTSILQFSAILFAEGIGFLVFGESVSIAAAFGTALIIAAGSAAVVISRRK